MASDIIYGLREDSVELSSKIQAAMVLMKDNKPKESIDVLSDIVADFKSKVPSIVYILRGTAYYNLRECQTSLSDYRQSLSIRYTKEAEFNFASATLCLCDYRKANNLFEKYVNSYPEDMSGHYNFASTHQLLNNLDKATEEYNIVIRNKSSLLEESYFNIGVVYALYFAQNNKIQDVDNSISYLQASIDASIAESKKKKTRDKKAEVKRRCMIKNAMVPIREREPACAGWYRTDDLTSLVGQSTFKEWWSRIEQDMTAEELKCEG